MLVPSEIRLNGDFVGPGIKFLGKQKGPGSKALDLGGFDPCCHDLCSGFESTLGGP